MKNLTIYLALIFLVLNFGCKPEPEEKKIILNNSSLPLTTKQVDLKKGENFTDINKLSTPGILGNAQQILCEKAIFSDVNYSPVPFRCLDEHQEIRILGQKKYYWFKCDGAISKLDIKLTSIGQEKDINLIAVENFNGELNCDGYDDCLFSFKNEDNQGLFNRHIEITKEEKEISLFLIVATRALDFEEEPIENSFQLEVGVE